MKITCEEYNRRWKKKNTGYVVRGFGDKWLVCDGYAPTECFTEVEGTAIFVGYVVKAFNTFKEADNLRNILNA